MLKKRIFIGSASESREPTATILAQLLADSGFDAVRWWTAFRPGDVTIERLRELATSIDGAVLICFGTDETWYRGRPLDKPRDNVILELGMFIQSLGKELAIVLADKSVSLPSDLDGMTYLVDRDDPHTSAERVVAHFRGRFIAAGQKPNHGIAALPIEVDPEIAKASLRQPLPREWHQRSLYIGTEGARGWLEVSEEPTTLRPTDEDKIRQLMLDSVRDAQVQTFISYGPGNGDLDREIAISLRNPSLIYLPIDISEGLLFQACAMLSEHVQLPLGLLSDFEDRMPFIRRRLSALKRPPILFGLLGNTFGNLDRFESTFFRQLEGWAEPGDLVLLQVSIAGEDWNPDNAPIGPAQHSDARKRFFAQGLSRQTNTSVEEILRTYTERIDWRLGRSDVPRACSVDFVDLHTGCKIQNLRWYRWASLLDWLKESGFRVKRERSHMYDGQNRGEGIILLERL